MDKLGRLYGVDQTFLERISKTEALGDIEVITSLKAYMPHRHSLCESISITLNPYYPGLTGNSEECTRTLATAGLERMVGRKLTELTQDELKLVVKAILGRVQDELGTEEIDIADYVGGILVSRTEKYGDFRMLADMIVNSVEWDGGDYPSGIYIARMTSGNYFQARKILLVK
jgi:hypothetical protein